MALEPGHAMKKTEKKRMDMPFQLGKHKVKSREPSRKTQEYLHIVDGRELTLTEYLLWARLGVSHKELM